jgi:Mg-chelatase subunit ChlD
MTNALNHVDLCFVIDTTGSMGGFIQAAKQQLLNTIQLLSTESNINLQIGLVEYRDHPPQDTSFVTRIYPLTSNLKQMQNDINKLEANGGGDFPEAVYDGIQDAATKMIWRTHSCRFILLVGDAPPHGFKIDDNFDSFNHTDPDKYPHGLTMQSVTATAENQRVTIHALCMNNEQMTLQSFKSLAISTGGQCANVSSGTEVIERIVSVLKNEFQNLEFDSQVLGIIQNTNSLDVTMIADILDCQRLQVASAIARLGKRDFLRQVLVN